MDLVERGKLIQLAEKDPNVADAAYQMAKNDPIDFMDMFGWVYEPRAGREHHIPVKLYDHQVDLVRWLEERYKNREDGLVEKSRDMGVTWCVAAFWGVWHWLFDPDFDMLIGSRKEDDVDNRMPDSIFGKIDYYIEHLPNFIKPQGYQMVKHRNHMKILNPENKNTIVGEATNPQFSRSGRYSVIFLDEFAFVEKSSSIWQACGDSTDVRIPVSTPNGKGNKFAELALGDQIQKKTLHWRLHPEKDDAWYENQKSRRTADEIAQELDISYTRSTAGRVYGDEWDQLVADGRLTSVPYDPILEVHTGWDFGISTTAIGFYQTPPGGAVRMIDYYENSGHSIDHYLKVLQDKQDKLGYRWGYHFGDIAGNSREMGTKKTVYEIMRDNGIRVKGKKIKKDDGINITKMFVRRMSVDQNKCSKFVDAIQNYHYEYDEDRMEFAPKPYHDWSSHACDQLEYMAVNLKGEIKKDNRPFFKKKFDKYSISTY
ncbi:MAG: hypothetical protein KKF62_19400 [Bacteroidetes bacterium]|nr:hypothetical protein [Bacteroidota bacterium]